MHFTIYFFFFFDLAFSKCTDTNSRAPVQRIAREYAYTCGSDSAMKSQQQTDVEDFRHFNRVAQHRATFSNIRPATETDIDYYTLFLRVCLNKFLCRAYWITYHKNARTQMWSPFLPYTSNIRIVPFRIQFTIGFLLCKSLLSCDA